MRILLYRLGSMGDTLVAMPCIHALRRRHPDAHIVWLTNLPINIKARAAADLLAGTGLIDAYMSYPLGVRNAKTLADLRKEIRAQQFDLVIHLAAARGLLKTVRDAFFFRLCGIPRIVGLPWRKKDLQCLPDPAKLGFYEPEARRLARRISAVAKVDLGDRTLWSLNLKETERDVAQRELFEANIERDYIVASVGTKADAKDWTAPNWIKFLTLVSTERPSLGIVMLGAPDEFERAANCLQGWRGPKVNFTGLRTVRESAAIMAGAKLFVGHDSGPMHLAASVNTRCIAIFAARNLPGHWFPAGEGHHVFYHQTECFGCGLDKCVVQRKKCILSIMPEDVAAVALKILGST